MNFDDFLNVLMKLSVKVFRRFATSKDEAFEMMLREKILPMASRRFPEDVAGIMTNRDVMKLFDYYDDGLRQIFMYYASFDKSTHKMIQDREAADLPRIAGNKDLAAAGRMPMNLMKEVMSYAG
jgi:hypothetical protein